MIHLMFCSFDYMYYIGIYLYLLDLLKKSYEIILHCNLPTSGTEFAIFPLDCTSKQNYEIWWSLLESTSLEPVLSTFYLS